MNKTYTDDRGTIEMVAESCEIGSISRIDSKPESRRANHFHKIDTHLIYISKGHMEIYERPVGSETKPNKTILSQGATHFTPSNIVHEMYFPVQNEFYCFSKLPRQQDNYEGDTVRVDFSLKDIYDNWKD